MKRLDAHRKLLWLLCLILMTCAGLVFAGCGGLFLEHTQSVGSSTNYEQLAEAFDRIVPGMTQAQDLPNLGLDPKMGNVDILSYTEIQARFLSDAGSRFEKLNPAVRTCIQAQAYCNGYVFHPGATLARRLSRLLSGLRGSRQNNDNRSDVILLVMNGRVVHKVFSGAAHTEIL
jgi:hypothetical protein